MTRDGGARAEVGQQVGAEPRVLQAVDLRPCKQRASALFPVGHPLREAILKEPDVLPAAEGMAKLETYVRLAFLLASR